ncbi:MAG: acryloyl-CoA reductase [Acidimicrobiia bacterium]
MADTFRAFTATQDGDDVTRAVVEMSVDDLPGDGLLVAVERSSVNYKDGLATIPKGRVARISPLIPGIDLAGTVTGEGSAEFPAGTAVLANGYDLGVSRHGGFSELARVPEGWLVRLPAGLDAREAMGIGTAGYTAGLSVLALEERGLTPGDGPVLVTGATGGVGSVAVSILAGRGYEVVASTGKASAESYLKGLGASSIVARDELAAEGGKPLEGATYAGAVDCVGGQTLANVLARLKPGAAVAASGNTGGMAVPTTVMPFILRGVSLLGIDSVTTPIERRRQVWELLGSSMKPAGLGDVIQDVTLGGLEPALDAILAGSMTGRTVVDTRA